jgi:hypothetical protein
MSTLLTRNGHAAMVRRRLLLGVERTCRSSGPTSEFDPTLLLQALRRRQPQCEAVDRQLSRFVAPARVAIWRWRAAGSSCPRSRPPGPFYLRIPAANQLPPPLTMSRTGLVQGVGGTGARVPSIRKSPLGSSGMRTESCITPGAGPQNNLARTL